MLIGLTTFAFISSNNIMTPLLPEIRDDFGVSITPVEGLQFGGGVGWNDVRLDADVVELGSVLFTKGDRLASSPE